MIQTNHDRKLRKASKILSALPMAKQEIFKLLPQSVIGSLTASQIADVCNAIDKSYHNGKESAGAEMIDFNAVYITSIGKIIEWHEAGAVYECVREDKGYGCYIEYSKKVKDGILIPRFFKSESNDEQC